MQARRFRNRSDAGARLAESLNAHGPPPRPLVLALPRGGVPVAAAIARSLGAPLDVLIVRKLGHPMQPELAVGAVASGGVRVLNPEFSSTVEPDELDAITAREAAEVERLAEVFRNGRPAESLEGRDVILVDDGIATGATMLAAVRAARAAGARHVVVAVPVGDPGTCARLGRHADRVYCPVQPIDLMAVGAWYDDFTQVTDDEVRALLRE
jgi:putative phosphoribosyl transferase